MDMAKPKGRLPWSNDVEKVFNYITRNEDRFNSFNWITYMLIDGEIRIQNNILGYIARAKPDQHGVWTIKVWLAGFNCVEFDERNLALAVAEVRDPHLTAQAVGDYLVDSDEAYQKVSHAISNVAINAAHHRDTEEIYARVPGLHIESSGGSCPFQADGTWGEGYGWYFRYRHGYAQLRVGWEESNEEEYQYGYMVNPHWTAGYEYSQEDDGVLTMPEFTKLFCLLASQLKSEPYAYEFAQINSKDNDKHPMPAIIRSWSAKQARLELDARPYPYNSARYEETEWAREPVSEDPRVYPWPAPKFTVLDA